MDKILRKRIFREFKANIFRYVALALMMIMGMYLVVAIVGAADMIADGTDKNTILYAHGRLDKTMFGSLRTVLTKN